MQRRIFYAVELTNNEYKVLQEFRNLINTIDMIGDNIYASDIKVDGLDEVAIEEIMDDLYCKGVIELNIDDGYFEIVNQSETGTTFFSLRNETLLYLDSDLED